MRFYPLRAAVSDEHYEARVIRQRDETRAEMGECWRCIVARNESMALHLATHDRNVSANQDTPRFNSELSTHYPYKSKGMPDAEAMHPSRWKGKR